MKEYQIVIVDFFTEAKKLASIKADSNEELEAKLQIIGKKNPNSIVVAYFEGDVIIGTRPINMQKELEKAKPEEIPPIVFIVKWRVLPSGDQILPDYSLPKVTKRIRLEKSIPSAKPAGRRPKPHRAEFKEVVPQAAGV